MGRFTLMTQVNRKFLKNLGLRLRELRNRRGLTLEATEEFGVKSWKHLQRIESGEANITMETLLQLAKIYKVHPSDVLKDL
jgi:transcriptional regulator with XRE-family HTH domain